MFRKAQEAATTVNPARVAKNFLKTSANQKLDKEWRDLNVSHKIICMLQNADKRFENIPTSSFNEVADGDGNGDADTHADDNYMLVEPDDPACLLFWIPSAACHKAGDARPLP